LPKRAVTVTLPAPYAAEIKCPICSGNKCKVCKNTGSMKINVAPKIPIQRAHIIKYVVENMHEVAGELTRMYGLTPEIHTKEIIEMDGGQYEVVQISSLGGACWVVNRLDELEIPRYFVSRKELEKFKGGMMIE
jgi:hypothetical protein